MIFSQYTNKNINEVLADLGASKQGLTKKEALLALEKFGPNEVEFKNVNAIQIFLRQLKSPFAYLLLVAALISILIGQFVDSIAVLSFIVINVTIGFLQEYRAEKAVSMLQKFIPHKIKVLRRLDNKSDYAREEIIDKNLLVPGDVVLLVAGDKVSADLRVMNLQNLLVDESALTGESVPVSKTVDALNLAEEEIYKSRNIIFSGSSIVSGKATAVVIATGKETVFGNILKTVSGIRRESTYEKSILYFCKLIMRIVATTIILIFLVNILLKGLSNVWELLIFSVALIVSILPEALSAVVTFSLSRGSIKLAKQNVVVKRLSAIEDLGNIEVLCVDKTGTLTQNKLALEETVSSDKKKCFLYGVLSSGVNKNNDKLLNPFDAALCQIANDEILRESNKFKIISELPFDSYRMRSAFLVQSTKTNKSPEKLLIVKGSSDSIIKNCTKFGGVSFTASVKKEIKEDISREGEEGKRVLAIAFKKMDSGKQDIKPQDEKDLTFLGYFVFEDPIKTTAKEAINLSKKLGVKIKIITGDSKEVAEYVARKTGLAAGVEDVISGQELGELSKDDFDDACETKSIFARISPDTKHEIIKSLQKRYEVGFMGEGVNDAPALKTADVGIAVLEASDIAREASDVVLLEKDLRVIINGIKDGRMIFANINKYIKCALASNFGNFYSIAVISIFINFLPILPIQILLGNILSDFPLILVATDSVDIDELRKPKAYQLHMVLPLIISLALVSTVFDFIFFSIFYNQAPANIQTLWYIESILTELLLIFVIRTRGLFYKAKKPGPWLLTLIIIDAIFVVILPFTNIGHEWFHFVSPPIIPLLIVFMLNAFYFVSSEIVKLVYFHYWKPKQIVIS